MMPSSLIKLNYLEVHLASQIGMMRQEISLQKGLKDSHGFDGENGWSIHIEGAGGEMAVAKYANTYWMGSVNTFKKINDVGKVEVRTRSRDYYDLLIRNDDKNEDVFVLVVGKIPDFKIVGWLKGKDAKKPEWLKTYANREAAYFVPQSELNSPESLIEMIK